MRNDIKSLKEQELKDWLSSVGHKPYRAEQIQNWLFKQTVLSWDAMVNMPQDLRKQLSESFDVTSLREHQRQISEDGTIKLAYQTRDDHYIETVMIPALSRPGEPRFSICVSTQVGCAMGCAFCRTAQMGFIRNLEAGEILEQIIRVQLMMQESGRSITNIIFMGMGEPLHNLDAVEHTCQILHHRKLFNMGRKRMTVSSSGVVPKIQELVSRQVPCMLAISLNGTNDEVRSRLMPVNRRWPLQELLAVCDEYIQATDHYVTFEYILIRDLTCTPQAAKELLKITQQRKCKVNAIVLNQGDDPQLQAPEQAEIDEFLDIVRAGHVQITLRTPRGRDIMAACGQLAIKQKKVA